MTPPYFKFRPRFELKAHRYDIGNPLVQNRKLENNFFFRKLYALPFYEFEDFFRYHRDYFISKYLGEEQEFFLHVLELVQDRIDYYKKADFYKNAERSLDNLSALKAFKKMLTGQDQWNTPRSEQVVIAEQEMQIAALTAEIGTLKSQIKELAKLDAKDTIRLSRGSLGTLIDLLLQIQELTLPSGGKMVSFQEQSPWYKMIAKYFRHGGEEIPLNTIRKFFQEDKSRPGFKSRSVPPAEKVFEILPKNAN